MPISTASSANAHVSSSIRACHSSAVPPDFCAYKSATSLDCRSIHVAIDRSVRASPSTVVDALWNIISPPGSTVISSPAIATIVAADAATPSMWVCT
jgi:hypothetical protein